MVRRHRALTATVLGVIGVLLLATILTAPRRQPSAPLAAAAPSSVHFTASGDFSAGSAAVSVFNAIGTIKPDLHLALGDLSYGTTGQEQAWCDLVTAGVGAGFPFQLLSGNHESNGQNGNINDFSACLPNQLPGLVGVYGRQWYVDVPQVNPLVRFVMISPNLPYPGETYAYTTGSPRYNWTASAIDGARTKTIPWVVVGMHKPCLSLGQYPCDPGTDLQQLLVTKKVDLVLHGHEHGYQRTKQLSTGPGCASIVPGTSNAGCIADADNDLVKGAGTVFTTVGTGGVSLRDMNAADPEAPYFAAYSGLNANPTFGSLDVTATADTLTASFARASGGTFADAFTIRPPGNPPPNTPPVAALSVTCTGLTCAADGSASSDADGTITSHAWDFGDGSTGTGATTSRTYAAAGTYTVTLTVTDDDGATNTATGTATATAPPPQNTLAADTFGRTLASGWGSADTGGAWSVSAGTTNFTVADGAGKIRVAAGAGPTAFLGSVSSTTTDLAMTIATDKPGSGSGLYVSTLARRIQGQGDYRAKLRFVANGDVTISLSRVNAAGAETALGTALVVAGLRYAVGDRLVLRVQAVGTNPTTLQAKVWKAGTTEPAGWQRTITDSTAGLQAAGGVGINAYLSSSATNAPITIAIDDLVATRP